MDPEIERLIDNFQESDLIETTESFLESYVEFASIDVADSLKVSLVDIGETWIEMGLPEQEREKLHHVFSNNLFEFAKQFQDEQKKKLKALYDFREYSLVEINKILKDLSLPEHKFDTQKSLLSQCKMLKIKQTEMENVKIERLSQLDIIVQKWKKIRVYLGETWEDPKFETGIPTEFELVMVRSNMINQEELYKKRKALFAQLKKDILQIAQEIEHVFNEDENFIKSEEIIYSLEIMRGIEMLKNKLEGTFKQITDQNEEKVSKLNRLFDRLKIDSTIRENIIGKKHSSIVQRMKYFDSEIEKYELIKLSMIKDITLDVRQKVHTILTRCRASDFSLPPFFYSSDNFTEPQLDLHEKFLEHLQTYSETFAPIFQQILNYEETMNKALELEVKIHDPNKYKNRGGALLTNERDHRILKKRLENLEREIIANTLKSQELSFSQYGFEIHNYFANKHLEYEDGVESVKAAYGKSKTNSKERIQVASATKKIVSTSRTPLKAKHMVAVERKKADYYELAFKRDLLESNKNNLQSTFLDVPIISPAKLHKLPRIALPTVQSRSNHKRRISRSVERTPNSKRVLFFNHNRRID